MSQPETEAYGDVDLFYRSFYDLIIGRGFVGWLQARSHAAMESLWSPTDHLPIILEVGAGSGNHLRYVRHQFDEYVQTDLRYATETSVRIIAEPRKIKISEMFANAEMLGFESHYFDRVIATCLLLHLADPEQALLEWRRVTRSGGWITILVPTEPGLLLRASRRVLTIPKANRLGYKGYCLFNARDHRNHIYSLRQLIRDVFKNDQIIESRYPFRIPSWNLNTHFVYQIRRS